MKMIAWTPTLVVVIWTAVYIDVTEGFSFLGNRLTITKSGLYDTQYSSSGATTQRRTTTTRRRRIEDDDDSCLWTMRKQKASDKKRKQRELREALTASNNKRLLGRWSGVFGSSSLSTTFSASSWSFNPREMTNAATAVSLVSNQNLHQYQFRVNSAVALAPVPHKKRVKQSRQRSRKKTRRYANISQYQAHFMHHLTAEFRAEEDQIMCRLKASRDEPLSLETAGCALFDMVPERRGNIFNDEVYRLTKAPDATTTMTSKLYQNKFCNNDIIVLTEQPNGSGDFFGLDRSPLDDDANTVQARVLSVGPRYIDISIQAGVFETAFGPAPNDYHKHDMAKPNLRLRMDRFFSSIPYERMVSILDKMTTVPPSRQSLLVCDDNNGKINNVFSGIVMDELLREAVLSTFSNCNGARLESLNRRLAMPPMTHSERLTRQVMKYIELNPKRIFPFFNPSQRNAISSALKRRLTLIQGPPGTGKTTVAAAIGFGFVHQCRNLDPTTKVLATAGSNVGADNLAESMQRLGLKVVRIGRPSAVSPRLWNCTLESAIHANPRAKAALDKAATMLSAVRDWRQKTTMSSRRKLATAAMEAAERACEIAATQALREADVIVCTSMGSLDPRLLAACGIQQNGDKINNFRQNGMLARRQPVRSKAPDGLPPICLPFVIVDEACQSVEPETLIPLTASNSCRSLVLLGDPCQLPPTVLGSSPSPLSVSLMERLAAILPPPPMTRSFRDPSAKDTSYLECASTKQAKEYLDKQNHHDVKVSYRDRFAGSFLLSVQYRMHPSISAFSSAIFYNGLLSTPSLLRRHRHCPLVLQRDFPIADDTSGVRFFHVGGRCHEQRGYFKSYQPFAWEKSTTSSLCNPTEAKVVLDLIQKVLQDDDVSSSIGIITPYSAQVDLIRREVASHANIQALLKQKKHVVLDIASVDGYQGRECNVVIFSAVRSNPRGNIGFLTDWRRMNVALTRSKSALLVVGDLATLEAGDKHWATFGKWCRGLECIIDTKAEFAKVQN